MSLGSFYRGTTLEQDGRFRNKEKKLMANINFPKELETLINPTKIQMKVIKEWIENKIKSILGFEDEFCVNYTINLIEEKIDPKKIHIQLIGFLNNETFNFMSDLWKLLIAAQNSQNGIPPELVVEEKKESKKNKSDEKMENIKCLEKILAKEDEKDKERNNISKKKYRDDDSGSEDKRRKRRHDSRSRSRSRNSYDKKHRKYSKEKKSKNKHKKRPRSKSRSASKDRRNRRNDKMYKKSNKEKDYREEINKPEEIKYATSEKTDKPNNINEKNQIIVENLEKSKKEILNMHIEKK